ncbi:hypothetical protein V491_03766 [Pseudogymnoascus sp. VKM F-3775]|nr:hypothetical protein V491_03766 [Pseudogymnoascus sp. VKM F-3775]
MADHKNEKKVQPSYSQVNSSKPKDKKGAKTSATLDSYLHGSPSVQERMVYQPVDKKYWKGKKASSKAELEHLEKIINKM